MIVRLLVALAVFVGMVSAAGAEAGFADKLSQTDRARIAGYAQARRQAIDAARAGGEPADVKVLEGVLSGEPQPILGADIRGDYRCRTVKLGGSFGALTVYGWFKCRIDEDDLGYRIVKLTGSQRFTGHLVDAEPTRLLFFGADHYADEKPRRYGQDADRDAVGFLLKVAERRYRLELPLPKLESQFDIVELERP